MLSHMRRRALLAVAVVSLTASACSSTAPRAVVETPPAEAPFMAAPPTLPPTPPHLDPTRSLDGPPLPIPVVIPADSYAPEPVVELGTMEIPAIGLRHRIFQGVTLHNIDRGPSHWTGSALPGDRGNTVFAAHRATHDQPFRRIDALVPGDKVVFTVGGKRSTYPVTGHLIVEPSNSRIAGQTKGNARSLYACLRGGSMAQRHVVQLELVR